MLMMKFLNIYSNTVYYFLHFTLTFWGVQHQAEVRQQPNSKHRYDLNRINYDKKNKNYAKST